jgi:hypothetical protein
MNIDQILARNQVPQNAAPMDIAMSVVLRARFSLLLGYYADMLFNKHNDAFIKTMDFLFQSVGYEKGTPEEVIAL